MLAKSASSIHPEAVGQIARDCVLRSVRRRGSRHAAQFRHLHSPASGGVKWLAISQASQTSIVMTGSVQAGRLTKYALLCCNGTYWRIEGGAEYKD